MTQFKPYLAIRLTGYNRLSFPVILNQLEQEKLDSYFQVIFFSDFAQLRNFAGENPCGLLLHSFMTSHLPQVEKELTWLTANRDPNLILLAGGSHTSGDPQSTLKLGFDYAYTGPVETAFTEFVKRYLNQSLPEKPCVIRAPELLNLDSGMPISRYMKTIPPLEITRGCYWNCQFCQTACQSAQHRSMKSIEEYHREMKKRDFHRRVNFICPSAFEYAAPNARQLNYDAIHHLLKYCRDNGTQFLEFGIFPSETRPNSCKAEFLDLIVQHCSNKKITIGAQSGSDRILKLMKRGHSTGDVEAACELASRKNLRPLVDIIMGFPGENRDDRQESLKFIRKMATRHNARVQVHYFLPLSGTTLYSAEPSPLDYRTIDTLNQYSQDGICTNWWETGRLLSQRLMEIRLKLDDIKIDYQKIDLANE